MGNDSYEPETILGFDSGGFLRDFLRANPDFPQLPLDERVERMIIFGGNPQTWFFRDAQVLDIFERVVLPSYHSAQDLHVASVGCSDGREAYSLLLRNWRQKGRLRIDAFDVNPKSIELAKTGEYEISADPYQGELIFFEALDAGTKLAYDLISTHNGNIPWPRFNHSYKKRLRFNDEAKARINFQIHNILRCPLPQQYDVVFLLNVLMHYNPKGRERILANVWGSMREDEWLLCETADMTDLNRDRDIYHRWMRI